MKKFFSHVDEKRRNKRISARTARRSASPKTLNGAKN
jgi:hypothetical protein